MNDLMLVVWKTIQAARKGDSRSQLFLMILTEQEMSFVRVWLHAVWATKRRIPFLTDSIRSRVFAHMVVDGRSKGIEIDRVNGYVDHVHMIFSLTSRQSIADIMHQVKGESSRWINANRLTDEPFAWQADYFVESVSDRNLGALRKYVDNQEDHHREIPFKEEQKRLKADGDGSA